MKRGKRAKSSEKFFSQTNFVLYCSYSQSENGPKTTAAPSKIRIEISLDYAICTQRVFVYPNWIRHNTIEKEEINSWNCSNQYMDAATLRLLLFRGRNTFSLLVWTESLHEIQMFFAFFFQFSDGWRMPTRSGRFNLNFEQENKCLGSGSITSHETAKIGNLYVIMLFNIDFVRERFRCYCVQHSSLINCN